MDKVAELLQDVLERDALVALTLTGAREKGEDACTRVTVKPVQVGGRKRYQFAYHRARKVTHRNLEPRAMAGEVLELLRSSLKQGHLRELEAEHHILVNRRGQETVRTRRAAPAQADLRHDRVKSYLIPEGEPVDFLVRLGVMSETGKVIAARYDKFRQINRYLEMVADVADALPGDRPLRIIDFGSGKSYLTFALTHYFRDLRRREVRVTGLDLKPDVVELSNRIAADLGYEQLSFEVGEIGRYETEGPVDLVVSLHACDTATDDALAKAVSWGTTVVLAAPCCEHELFRQVRSETQAPLLKHGILRERAAALITDAARAQLLELAGYSVQVLEFIETEHTPKNLLIRAVRRSEPRPSQDLQTQYTAFRDAWHIHPRLETLLAEGKAKDPPPPRHQDTKRT